MICPPHKMSSFRRVSIKFSLIRLWARMTECDFNFKFSQWAHEDVRFLVHDLLIKNDKEHTKRLLTWAWVNSTRRFRLCANGNCIGFESDTLHAARLLILLMWLIEPPAELPINRDTETKQKIYYLFDVVCAVRNANVVNFNWNKFIRCDRRSVFAIDAG